MSAAPRSVSPTGDHVPTISAHFSGRPISAPAGASVAAALMSEGVSSWRTTRKGESRGVFCGIGICFDCLVEIDGESGQRACMIPLAEGMEIHPAQNSAEPGATVESSPAAEEGQA